MIVAIQLPSGSSLARTTDVVRRAEEIILDTPGVARAPSFAGFNGATFTLSHGIPPKQDQGGAKPGPPPKQLFTIDAEKELYALEADEFAAPEIAGHDFALVVRA